MKTTHYMLLDLVAGMEHDSIRVRTLGEREFINGRLVSTTLRKSTTKQNHSPIRLNTNISAEYVLTEEQFQSLLRLDNLFLIDDSLLIERIA